MKRLCTAWLMPHPTRSELARHAHVPAAAVAPAPRHGHVHAGPVAINA